MAGCRTPRNSKAQIIRAIKKTARKLKRVPTRKEFNRLGGMTASQVKWAFGSYEAGLRAAGVRKLGPIGPIGTTQLLEDWGRVVREVGRHPSVSEYRAFGKYSEVPLISRIGRWCNVREMFLEFVRSNGLDRDWADVVQSLEKDRRQRRVLPTAGFQERRVWWAAASPAPEADR